MEVVAPHRCCLNQGIQVRIPDVCSLSERMEVVIPVGAPSMRGWGSWYEAYTPPTRRWGRGPDRCFSNEEMKVMAPGCYSLNEGRGVVAPGCCPTNNNG